MIVVRLNQPQFEYDIHSLVKAFYPAEEVKVFEKGTKDLESTEGLPECSVLFEEKQIIFSVRTKVKNVDFIDSKEAIAEGKTLTGFIFDMNGLKYINDTFGHNEGDFAIQVIGHALSSTTRSGDICARFSGDEFYMLSSNYTEEEAADLLARVHKYLSNYNKLSHKEYQITTSGGFAQAVPHPGFTKEDLKELYAKADKEMYIQKREAHGARE